MARVYPATHFECRAPRLCVRKTRVRAPSQCDKRELRLTLTAHPQHGFNHATRYAQVFSVEQRIHVHADYCCGLTTLRVAKYSGTTRAVDGDARNRTHRRNFRRRQTERCAQIATQVGIPLMRRLMDHNWRLSDGVRLRVTHCDLMWYRLLVAPQSRGHAILPKSEIPVGCPMAHWPSWCVPLPRP